MNMSRSNTSLASEPAASLVFIISLVLLLTLTDCLTISGEANRITTPPGINISFPCIVTGEDYREFYHQIIWYKVMFDDGDDMQINTGAIINPLFQATRRYSVEQDVASQQKLVSVPLLIKDISLADNGTYHCDLMSTKGLIDSITHDLIVTAPVDEVVLYVNQTDDTDTVVKSYTDTSVVELTLDESVVISCRCVGGHPAPILKVFHGDEELGGERTRRHDVSRSGSRGFQVTIFETEVTYNKLGPLIEWSRKLVKCVAEIPNNPEYTTFDSKELRILYPPSFRCDSERYVVPHTKDCRVDCLVKANPSIDIGNLVWVIGDTPGQNGTLLRIGDKWNGYAVEANRHYRDVEAVNTVLIISSVDEDAFQTYGIRVKNSIQEKKYRIKLARAVSAHTKPKHTSPPYHSTASHQRPKEPETALSHTSSACRQLSKSSFNVWLIITSLAYLVCS